MALKRKTAVHWKPYWNTTDERRHVKKQTNKNIPFSKWTLHWVTEEHPSISTTVSNLFSLHFHAERTTYLYLCLSFKAVLKLAWASFAATVQPVRDPLLPSPWKEKSQAPHQSPLTMDPPLSHRLSLSLSLPLTVFQGHGNITTGVSLYSLPATPDRSPPPPTLPSASASFLTIRYGSDTAE